jgi:DNA-binding GntR family transcriptional regulator
MPRATAVRPTPTARSRFSAIDRRSAPLSDAVYQAIRDALRQGDIATGSRLVEGDLAAALSVSRTPVRDALRRLEADGLVRSEPNRGFVVADLMDDAAQVFLIRERLEGLAAALAAEHITRPELESLDPLQQEMEAIVGSNRGAVDRLVELNGELHRRITAACGSPRLIRMIERLHPEYMSFQVLRLYSDEQRRRSIREHREILDALWRREPELADIGIQRHLEHGKEVVLASMRRGISPTETTTSRTGRGTTS